MMARMLASFLFLLLLFPSSTPACSLCAGGVIKRNTFGQDFDRWSVIVYGKVIASRLSTDPRMLPGSGESDFVVERVLKGHPSLVMKKKMKLPGFIPVLD